MARAPSAILTPKEVKTAETLTALKAELKLATAGLKELTKNAKAAETIRAKAEAGVTKLTAKIEKLTPAKAPVVQSVTTPVAKAA